MYLFPGKAFEKESHNIKQRVHSTQNHDQSEDEKRKFRFWLQKGIKIQYENFSGPKPLNCGWFHLLLLSHNHFIEPKAEKEKIPFLVTKSGQKSNLTRFSDPRPPNCEWFHLLFLIYDHFIDAKIEKHRILFLVTKRSKKSNLIRFFDPRPPNCG